MKIHFPSKKYKFHKFAAQSPNISKTLIRCYADNKNNASNAIQQNSDRAIEAATSASKKAIWQRKQMNAQRNVSRKKDSCRG